MLWLAGALMGVTGVLLVIGSSVTSLGNAYGVILWLHDLGFLLIAVFGWRTSSWARASSSPTAARIV